MAFPKTFEEFRAIVGGEQAEGSAPSLAAPAAPKPPEGFPATFDEFKALMEAPAAVEAPLSPSSARSPVVPPVVPDYATNLQDLEEPAEPAPAAPAPRPTLPPIPHPVSATPPSRLSAVTPRVSEPLPTPTPPAKVQRPAEMVGPQAAVPRETPVIRAPIAAPPGLDHQRAAQEALAEAAEAAEGEKGETERAAGKAMLAEQAEKRRALSPERVREELLASLNREREVVAREAAALEEERKALAREGGALAAEAARLQAERPAIIAARDMARARAHDDAVVRLNQRAAAALGRDRVWQQKVDAWRQRARAEMPGGAALQEAVGLGGEGGPNPARPETWPGWLSQEYQTWQEALPAEAVPIDPRALPQMFMQEASRQSGQSPEQLIAADTPRRFRWGKRVRGVAEAVSPERPERPYAGLGDSQITRGLAGGLLGMVGSGITGLRFLEKLQGLDTPIGRTAEDVGRFLSDTGQAINVSDPKFFDQVWNGFGSMAAFAIMVTQLQAAAVATGVTGTLALGTQALRGMAFAKAFIQRFPKLTKALENVSGTAGQAGVLESLAETGDTYQSLTESGRLSEPDVLRRSTGVLLKNLILNPFLNRIGVFADPKIGEGAFKRAARGFIAEAEQEKFQELIQQQAQKLAPTDRFGLDNVLMSLNQYDWQRVAEAWAVGGIVGAPTAVILGSLGQPPPDGGPSRLLQAAEVLDGLPGPHPLANLMTPEEGARRAVARQFPRRQPGQLRASIERAAAERGMTTQDYLAAAAQRATDAGTGLGEVLDQDIPGAGQAVVDAVAAARERLQVAAEAVTAPTPAEAAPGPAQAPTGAEIAPPAPAEGIREDETIVPEDVEPMRAGTARRAATAPTGPAAPAFTVDQVQQALEAAGQDYLRAALALAPDESPTAVQAAASAAARLLPAFRQAMGNRPRTVAQVAAELTRLREAEGGFDPADPEALARFVLDRGGIAPSPSGDLKGEYAALPRRFKSPHGLPPDRMAEAIEQETGQPISDAEVLARLEQGSLRRTEDAKRRATEAAREVDEERRAEELARLRAADRDEKLARLQALLGATPEEAAATLDRFETLQRGGEFDPREFAPEEFEEGEGRVEEPRRAYTPEQRQRLQQRVGEVDAWARQEAERLGVPYHEWSAEQARNLAQQWGLPNAIAPGDQPVFGSLGARLFVDDDHDGRPVAVMGPQGLAAEEAAPRTEQTPMGEQGLIEGTPRRAIPGKRTRALVAQSPWGETPLGRQARQEAEQTELAEEPTAPEEPPEPPIAAGAEVQRDGKTYAVGRPSGRLFRELGETLYDKPIDAVDTKELIQNAIDAVRGRPSPTIRYRYDTQARTIEVEDNGKGMGPSIAVNEFVDPGESGKAEDLKAAGKFGVAKIALLFPAESIYVTTTAAGHEWLGDLQRAIEGLERRQVAGDLEEDQVERLERLRQDLPRAQEAAARGAIIRTTLQGKGGVSWLNSGLEKTEEDMPAGTPTGTTVRIAIGPKFKASRYEAEQFLQQLVAFQRLGLDLDLEINGQQIAPSTYNERPEHHLVTIDIPGGQAHVYVGDRMRAASYMNAHILNSGLPQYLQDFYFGRDVKMPAIVAVDVVATVDSEHADYPWPPNRERLREAALGALKEYFTQQFLPAYAKRESNALKEALLKAPRLRGTKLILLDPTQSLPADAVAELASDPLVIEVARLAGRMIGKLQETQTLQRWSPKFAEVKFAGLVLKEGLLGVNYALPRVIDGWKGNGIYLNPFALSRHVQAQLDAGVLTAEEGPIELAREIVETLVHELTHQINWEHDSGQDSSFSQSQAKILMRLRPLVGSMEKRLHTWLSEDGHARYLQLGTLSDHVRSLSAGGADLFGKIGSEQSEPEPLPGAPARRAEPGEAGGARPGAPVGGPRQGVAPGVAPAAAVPGGGPRLAPVRWRGWQERVGGQPPLPWWDLTEDIPGHPVGSTVGAETLREAGYEVPEPPVPAPTRPLGAHTYSSTEIRLPWDLATAIRRFGQSIPQDQLTGEGVDTTPHVTVLYGLHLWKSVDRVREALGAPGPIEGRLGELAVFTQPDQDVLVVTVDSPALAQLHQRLRESLPARETHTGYVPHVTVAYLRPGEGRQYVGDRRFAGRTFTAEEVVFSPKDGGEPTVLPLEAPPTSGRVEEGRRPYRWRVLARALQAVFDQANADQVVPREAVGDLVEPAVRAGFGQIRGDQFVLTEAGADALDEVTFGPRHVSDEERGYGPRYRRGGRLEEPRRAYRPKIHPSWQGTGVELLGLAFHRDPPTATTRVEEGRAPYEPSEFVQRHGEPMSLEQFQQGLHAIAHTMPTLEYAQRLLGIQGARLSARVRQVPGKDRSWEWWMGEATITTPWPFGGLSWPTDFYATPEEAKAALRERVVSFDLDPIYADRAPVIPRGVWEQQKGEFLDKFVPVLEQFARETEEKFASGEYSTLGEVGAPRLGVWLTEEDLTRPEGQRESAVERAIRLHGDFHVGIKYAMRARERLLASELLRRARTGTLEPKQPPGNYIREIFVVSPPTQERLEEPRRPYQPGSRRHEALIRRAIDYYGTTEDWNEAGYVLPDGQMLDLSGKKHGVPGGQRVLDHREGLSEIMSDWDPGQGMGSETRRMREFMRRSGAIRLHPALPGFDFVVPPADAQIRVAVRAAREMGEPLTVDRIADGERVGSWTFDRPTVDEVREAIEDTPPPAGRVEEERRAYQPGQVPAEPTPPFFSALRRVIEQKMANRAKPEEVLRLIKSATGVKADEIKWTYIEEWLAEQGERVTKQAVLDYLRDYGVQVVEDLRGGVMYAGDSARQARFAEAFRDVATTDPTDEMVAFATRYGREIASYHVSGDYALIGTEIPVRDVQELRDLQAEQDRLERERAPLWAERHALLIRAGLTEVERERLLKLEAKMNEIDAQAANLSDRLQELERRRSHNWIAARLRPAFEPLLDEERLPAWRVDFDEAALSAWEDSEARAGRPRRNYQGAEIERTQYGGYLAVQGGVGYRELLFRYERPRAREIPKGPPVRAVERRYDPNRMPLGMAERTWAVYDAEGRPYGEYAAVGLGAPTTADEALQVAAREGPNEAFRVAGRPIDLDTAQRHLAEGRAVFLWGIGEGASYARALQGADALADTPTYQNAHRHAVLDGEAELFESTERYDRMEEYRPGHFGGAVDTIAHVRFDEHWTPEGQRVLLIQEIQDDADNEIRDKKGDLAQAEAALARRPDIATRSATVEGIRKDIARLEALLPFRAGKSNDLVLKRLVRWAAEHGYDALGLATGEQQVKLYHLTGRKAEGKRETYDKILPAILNKLGKPWGTRSDDVRLQGVRRYRIEPRLGGGQGPWALILDRLDGSVTGQTLGRYETEARAREALETLEQEHNPTVHALPITPEMRAGVVQQGFALFEPRREYRAARSRLQAAGDLTQTDAFRRWFGDSKVVDEAGRPKIVYRGDYRADRLGTRLRLDRATSAAGFFFTEDPAIASSYATNKVDAGAIEEANATNDFRRWFRFRVPAERRSVDLAQFWDQLSPEQQARVQDVFLATGETDEGQFDFSGAQPVTDREHWERVVREHRGNWLMAGQDVWIASGILFDDEGRFLEILEQAGLTGEFVDPRAPASAVTPVYLSIQNPLDVVNIPDSVVRRFKEVARSSRRRPQPGADALDVNSITPREWLDGFLMERAVFDSTFSWTSVPREIVRALQDMGYDGVKDTGGKMGGPAHRVWIAFRPEQVKSPYNRGTFDPRSPNILREERREYLASQPPAEPAPAFYSMLLRVAEQRLLRSQTPVQALNILKSAKGVKGEEIKWVGLEAWLGEQGDKVTKDAVLEFLRAHQVRIATRTLPETRRSDAEIYAEAEAETGVDISEERGPGDFPREWSSGDPLAPDPEWLAEMRRENGENWEPAEEDYEYEYTHPTGYRVVGNEDAGYEVSVGEQRVPGSPDEVKRRGQSWVVVDPRGRVRQGAFPSKAAARAWAEDQANRREITVPRFFIHRRGRGVQRKARDAGGGGIEWPSLDDAMNAAWSDYSEIADRYRSELEDDSGRTRHDNPNLTLPGGQNYRERLYVWPAGTLATEGERRAPTLYTPPEVHFDQPNMFAHNRFKDRLTIANEKVVATEELQGDWRRELVDRGERSAQPPTPITALPDDYTVSEQALPHRPRIDAESGWRWVVRQPDGVVVIRGTTKEEATRLALAAINADRRRVWAQAVPAFPFAKTWWEVAMKDLIREAALSGAKYVAWTTAQQQIDRYNLARHVTKIEWWQAPDGSWSYQAIARARGRLPVQQDLSPDDLRAHLGREVAERILGHEGATIPLNEQPVPGEWRAAGELAGLALETGGEDHKKFYDQMLPRWAEKYGKAWGATVTRLDMSHEIGPSIVRQVGARWGAVYGEEGGRPDVTYPTREQAERLAKDRREMWALEIPQAMRDAVLGEGQALFENKRQYETLRSYPVRLGDDEFQARQLAFEFFRRTRQPLTHVNPDWAALPLMKPSPGRAAPVPTQRGGNLILARGIDDRFAKAGTVPLRGWKVQSEQDIAMLAHLAIRGPVETFGIVAVKGGKVLATQLLSSRLPGSSSVFDIAYVDKDAVPGVIDTARAFNDLRRWMERLGADGYYLTHNHNSGVPNPSTQDLVLTADFQVEVPGFRGHVVIDSGEYGFIAPGEVAPAAPIAGLGRGFARVIPVVASGVSITKQRRGQWQRVRFAAPARRQLPGAIEQYRRPQMPHPLLGRDLLASDKVAEAAAQVAVPRGYILLMGLDGEGRLMSMEAKPRAEFIQEAPTADYLAGMRRRDGLSYVIAYAHAAKDEQALGTAFRLIRDHHLSDFVTADVGASDPRFSMLGFMQARGTAGPRHAFEAPHREMRPGAYRLREGQEEYQTPIQRDLDIVGRAVYAEVQDYEGWAERMRGEVPAAFHALLPASFGRITAAPPTGGETIAADQEARPAPQAPPNPAATQAGQVQAAAALMPQQANDILERLRKLLGVPISVGRLGGDRGRMGIFKRSPGKAIRLKVAEDLATAAHETGHFVGDLVWNPRHPGGVAARAAFFAQHQADLMQLAQQHRKPTAEEGYAEFWRFYLQNQGMTGALYPTLTQAIEAELMRVQPAFLREIQAIGADYQAWRAQDPRQRIQAHVDRNPVARVPDLRESMHTLYTWTFWEGWPLERVVGELSQGRRLPPELDAALLRKTLAGAPALAERFLFRQEARRGGRPLGGALAFTTRRRVGMSLEEVLEPIRDRWEDWEGYMIGRRLVEMWDRTDARAKAQRQALSLALEMTEADARTAVAAWEQDHPEYRAVADDFQQWNEQLLQYLVDADVMAAEDRDKILDLNRSYIPFYRVFSEALAEAPPKGAGGGEASVRSPVKAMTGSGRKFASPIEGAIRNAYVYVMRAERNAVMEALAKLADKTPGSNRIMEQVPPAKRISRVGIEEAVRQMKADLAKQGVPWGVLNGIDLNQMIPWVQSFRPDYFKVGLPGEVWVLRAGKPIHYQIHDPELYRALSHLDRVDVSWLDNLMGRIVLPTGIEGKAADLGKAVRFLIEGPARLLRAGATLAPEFIMRNPGRDVVSRMIYTAIENKTGIGRVDRALERALPPLAIKAIGPYLDAVRVVHGFLKGVMSTIGQDEWWDAYMRGGGAMSALALIDPQRMQKQREDLLKEPGVILNPVSLLRITSGWMEEANRIGEFRDVLEAMGTTGAGATKGQLLTGTQAGRDVTLDFRRFGIFLKATGLARIAAFSNPSWQGWDKLGREFNRRPGLLTYRLLMLITLPSLLLWWWNHDDPRWAEIPQWQKDVSWIIFTSRIDKERWAQMDEAERLAALQTTVLRLPKAFELGVLFGSIPERMAEWLTGQNPDVWRSIGQSLGAALGMALVPIPTVVAPVLMAYMNYSWFFGRPVVPRSLQDIEPEYQAGPGTSRAAEWLAHGISVATAGKAPDMVRSPAVLDFLLQGYGGNLMRLGINVADLAIKALDPGAAPEPTWTPADWPGVRGFIVRFPSSSAESIERFYSVYTEAYKVARTASHIEKKRAGRQREGKTTELERFEADHELALLAYPALAASAKAIKEGRAILQDLRDDRDLSPQAKRDQIDQVTWQMIAEAREALGYYQDLKVTYKDAAARQREGQEGRPPQP